jgi:hypothetical protein
MAAHTGPSPFGRPKRRLKLPRRGATYYNDPIVGFLILRN